MMKQFLSSPYAKQKWLRLFFSLSGAIFLWWYVHESIIGIKIFTEVPVYVRNIPPGKTIAGMKKEIGKLSETVTLVLRGRKRELDLLRSDQLEVTIDASDRGNVWHEELSLDNIRCFNPDVVLHKVVDGITHSALQFQMSSKTSRDVPLLVLNPVGNLPKGYSFLNIWPRRFSQNVQGPEDSIATLHAKQIYFSFELTRISKQELDHLSQEVPLGGEFFYPIPDNWKQVTLPYPFTQETQKIHDPDAAHLMLILLKPGILQIPNPIPINISSLPYLREEAKIHFDEETMHASGKQVFWNSPIYIQNVSQEFLTVIAPHLQMNIYIGQKENVTVAIEMGNLERAEGKYIEYMLRRYPDAFKGNERDLKSFLKEHFWRYIRSMGFLNSEKRALEFEASIKENLISMQEMTEE